MPIWRDLGVIEVNENDKSTVYLLCDSSSLDDFIALAERENWSFGQQHDGDGKVMGFSQVRIALDGETEIHYVDEPALGMRFLVTRGPSSGNVSEALARDLEIRTSINVVRHARKAQTDERKRTSAFELAVIFLEFDPRALEIMQAYYEEGSEPVRRRVISALTYRGWSEGVAMLEYIAQVDTSLELRQLANEMAEMWKKRAHS